jgi:hypothetical protein
MKVLALTFNIDDTCAEWGYSMDHKFELKLSKASLDWMDETRFNPVAVIEGDKMKRICVHIRPVVAETGRLICLLTFNKDRNIQGVKVFVLRESVDEYAIYYALVGPNVNQIEFENIIHSIVIIPSIEAEKKRLENQFIFQQTVSINDITISEGIVISDEDLDIIKTTAKMQYSSANIFTDGAQGLVNALARGKPLAKTARDKLILYWKWAAQHSLCQNSLDSSHSFSIIKSQYEGIRKTGTLSNEIPSYHDALEKILLANIDEESRRSSISVFHSHLSRIVQLALSQHVNAKGWISNGMGVGVDTTTGLSKNMFSLKQWMNHWKEFKELTDEDTQELYSLFWDKLLPMMTDNLGFITHSQLHDIFKDFLDLDYHLEVLENRNGISFNQGFAMPMQKETFQSHAEERIRLQTMKDTLIANKKAESNAGKLRDKLNNQNIIKNLCKNVDEKLVSDIGDINTERDTFIRADAEKLKSRITEFDKRLKAKNLTQGQKDDIKDDIKRAKEESKEMRGQKKKNATKACIHTKMKSKNERNSIIAAYFENLRQNGAILPEVELDEDESEINVDNLEEE